MKKRWLPYVIFGFVLYLLFLVIEMPASWFAWGLNRYTGGTVRLDPIAGGMWHGNGKLMIYYPQTTPHDLGITEWHINPIWLFAGRIQTNWQSDTADARINATLRVSPGKITLVDTDAAFPAQYVALFYPPAALVSPQGKVQLHVHLLTIDRNGITGGGEIHWQDAGSSLTSVQPLGDYHFEITGAGKTARFKLSTTHGALELIGQGQWQIQGGQFQINGTAIPRERLTELEPLLKLLGPAQDGGRRTLALNGRLAL